MSFPEELSHHSSLILGDNHVVLPQLIENGFREKFKCIYLDPPYNDSSQVFYDPIIDSSVWGSELKKRLIFLRDCLRKDGIVCLSINDHELPRLRLIGEEVFGRQNFVCTFIWLTKKGAQGIPRKSMVMPNHEYILIFAKNIKHFSFIGKPRSTDKFANPDQDPRGFWKRQYLQRFGFNFPEQTIVNPENGMEFTFETPYTKEKLDQWIEEKRIVFPQEAHQYPMRKEFFTEYRKAQQLTTFLGLYSTKSNTEKLNSLFEGIKIFPYTKPIDLLVDLFAYSTENEDWIMDPYAGSGTTGQSVLELNQSSNGNRKFMLIQNELRLPASSNAFRAGYKTVFDVTCARIKRVEERLKINSPAKVYRNDGDIWLNNLL